MQKRGLTRGGVAEIVASVIWLDETNAMCRRLLAIALGVVAVVAAGCGGGANKTASVATAVVTRGPGTAAGGSSTPARPATKASIVAQANAICARRNRELKAAIPSHASLSKVVKGAPGRAAIEQKALAELGGLTPPTDMTGAWKTAIAAIQTEVQGTLALAKYAGASDSASLRREKALLDKPQLRLFVAAARAGVRQCGVVAGPSVLGL
jgi:hypothetical protein